MTNLISPNYFRMRFSHEMPLYKRIIWRVFGKKDWGEAEGIYVEGYWFRGVCLITKYEVMG